MYIVTTGLRLRLTYSSCRHGAFPTRRNPQLPGSNEIMAMSPRWLTDTNIYWSNGRQSLYKFGFSRFLSQFILVDGYNEGSVHRELLR
jgi:hypothetical protein